MAPASTVDLDLESKCGKQEKAPITKTVWPPLDLEEHPIDEYPRLRVVVIGAGISGITAGVLLPPKVPALDLVIYERNSDIGGVWHTNVYPGVRCDVPAHAYQATFAPSTSWTEAYAQGAEINEYWNKVADDFGVRQYVRLEHSVKSAEWSEEKGKWLVRVKARHGEFIDEANFVLTAIGHFSDPKLPNYPGMDIFKGDIFHTSDWKRGFDPSNKRIAVIGNGASGLQVLPHLQKAAKHLDHYARNKTWVAAPIGGETLADYVADGIEQARKSPEDYLKFRKGLEGKLFSRFGGIFKGSDKNAATEESIRKLMAGRLAAKPELIDQIVPEFSPNCRRLTPGPGYLEALTAENVSYITRPIFEFTETGIRTVDGIHREVEAVVCSTGHDITFSTQFPVICNGVDLQSAWRPGGSPGFPDSYLGLAAPGFPNFLTIVGPNSTGPAGTLCHSVEIQITYIAKVLRKAVTQGIRSLAPTQAATDDFRAYCEAFFPRTVMSEYCSSWYNGGIKGGRITGIWPGSAGHVAIVRKDPRWEDFEFTYHNGQGNRFAWLGNGWTRRDVLAADGPDDIEADLTPWLRAEAIDRNIDLRDYHESWWVS